MKVLIVDDEPLARQHLARMLASQQVSAELVGEAVNGAEAVLKIESLRPDLVLMDIQMPVVDGLEAARQLRQLASPPLLVFVTAHPQHALGAFEADALDYLLKPVRPEKLGKALEKAELMLSARTARQNEHQEHWLVSDHGGTIRRLALTEVIYFRADTKYVVARHTGGEMLLDDTLANLEVRFGDDFLRVHRNALAARSRLILLRKGPGERNLLSLRGADEELEVSRRHLAQVRAALSGE